MKSRFLVLAGIATLGLAVGTALEAAAPPAEAWSIGPIIKGRNYSVGMPRTMSPGRDGPWFDFPVAADRRPGHVHYVTLPTGPLPPDATIRVRYRVDAAPGTRFVPQEVPDEAATVSLVLQRRGDNWSARRGFEHYRWYVPPAKVARLRPGVHTMTVRLDDPQWGNVFSGTSTSHPRQYLAALDDLESVGLVFGSMGLRGHGVYATAPARFTLLDFSIG